MDNEILYIKKRNFFDCYWCQQLCIYMLLLGVVYYVFKIQFNTGDTMLLNIIGSLFILTFGLWLFGSFFESSSINNFLKDGQVIWAIVDQDMLYYNDAMLSVYCYVEKEGQKTYYKATQGVNRRLGVPVMCFFVEKGRIPVVVDSEDDSRYVVLLKEMIDICDDRKKTLSRLDVIRKIGWMEIL